MDNDTKPLRAQNSPQALFKGGAGAIKLASLHIATKNVMSANDMFLLHAILNLICDIQNVRI